MNKEKFHICFVLRDIFLGNKNFKIQGLLSIAKKLKEQNCKITFISYKGPNGVERIETDDFDVFFVCTEKKFISIQNFTQGCLKLIEKIHKETPVHHIHSVDHVLKGKGKRPSIKKISLSYGSESLHFDELFSLFGSPRDTLKNLLKLHVSYPIYFIFNYFLPAYNKLREAKGFFVSSPKEALALERYYLYPPDHIYQIPLAANMVDLNFRDKSDSILQKYKLKPYTPILATASNMKRPSDFIFLFDVFEQVALKHPDAKFLIIGEGPHFKEIEELSLLKVLDSKVIFTKKTTRFELAEYISISDIFINMNATTSGLGATLMEAMAQKKVIIGSAFSPISHIIENGKNGYLIRPGEIASCVQLIDQIFSEQIDSKKLGDQAREDILKLLNKDELASKALSSFKKMSSWA